MLLVRPTFLVRPSPPYYTTLHRYGGWGVTDRTVTTGFGRGREFIPPHPSYIGFGQGGDKTGDKIF